VSKKTLKYAGIGIACLTILLGSSTLLYKKYLQHRVAVAHAIQSPPGIDSLDPVQIGRIEQWIEVRGKKVSNPILLFIHGGPGIAFIPLAGAFQGPWEQYFTVIQWDQRGAGKTYAANA
jgi:proline iminopeptidase